MLFRSMPDGKTWRFHAGGAPVEVEASVSFATAGGPRAAQQIVVQADAATTPAISWSLERL